MPRVGSSKIKTRGRNVSHFASTTFCWLPPLKFATRISGVGVLILMALIASTAAFSSLPKLINFGKEEKAAVEAIKAINIKTPTPEMRVANLSGGNQQKVVLAKWLTFRPRVLIFDEPTRGIDVGAKAEIYELIRGLAAKGVSVIVISSEMEEVLGISDRIAVMHEGRLTGILDRAQFSEEAVMRLATGTEG